ncbi:MAG: response regulator [Gammaproteobacteria bacterium]|jgi:CheY-like chemotaxis protein|nr:response regulator [Gammaproteobacteria bacterium]
MPDQDSSILLIEDDRVDVMTVERALRKNQFAHKLYVARSALEALNMLRGRGVPKIDPPPTIILLDLNLPKMSGIEFLEELRSDVELRDLAVIVLTSSNEPRDQEAAFKYEVEDYFVKPHSFDEFSRMMATILSEWTRTNT